MALRSLVKDKANHTVVLDKATAEKLQKDVQSYRLITVAVLVDRLKINGSVARQALADLEEKGLIKKVVSHARMRVWSELRLGHCKRCVFVLTLSQHALSVVVIRFRLARVTWFPLRQWDGHDTRRRGLKQTRIVATSSKMHGVRTICWRTAETMMHMCEMDFLGFYVSTSSFGLDSSAAAHNFLFGNFSSQPSSRVISPT
jgi:small subunit ribosomal protein S25e